MDELEKSFPAAEGMADAEQEIKKARGNENCLGFWIYFYLLFAMKRMYEQSWRKTITKFVLFSFGFMFFLGVGLTMSALAVLLMI